MKAINKKLKELIAEKGYSVYKITKLSGVDYKGMYTFVNSDRELSYDNMIKLMKALGYKVAMIKLGSAATRVKAATLRRDEIIDIGKLTSKV